MIRRCLRCRLLVSTPISGVSGATAVTNATVLAGTYTLSETGGQPGYTNGTTWNCGVGATAVTAVDVPAGGNVTCTVTNTRDRGTLTLVKAFSGTAGDPALFTLSAAGPTPVSGVSGAAAVTGVLVDTGTYTLSETGGQPGYTNGTTWNCGAGATAVTAVDVPAGGNVTCTVTNTRDRGTLTLVKVVVSGTSPAASSSLWTLSAAGPTPISGVSGAAAVTAAAVDTGNYTLAETGVVANYTNGTTWDCGAGATAVTTVDVPAGGNVTCTITNRLKAIDLVKSIAWATGGTCPTTGYVDSLSPVTVGEGVCYQFIVTNIGAADLPGVTISDPQVSTLNCAVPNPLAAGVSYTCYAGPIAVVFNNGAPLINTATACSGTLCDTDRASYVAGYNGFTPGFWKNHTTAPRNAWAPQFIGACSVTTSTLVGSVFVGYTGTYASRSLLQALGLNGGNSLDGARQILLRAAVAAYLNACYSATLPGTIGDYPLTTTQIVTQTVAALNSTTRGTIISLASTLDLYNNTATHIIAW